MDSVFSQTDLGEDCIQIDQSYDQTDGRLFAVCFLTDFCIWPENTRINLEPKVGLIVCARISCICSPVDQ